MSSTVIIIAAFLSLLALSAVLWGVFLRLGLWWARISDVTLRRIVWATAGVMALQMAMNALFRLMPPSSEEQAIVLTVAALVAGVAIPSLVIAGVFKASFFRSIQAWLPTLLPSFGMWLFVLLVFRPFVFEALVSPTNAMAPTLLGGHWRGVCPECGQATFCTPVGAWYGPPQPPWMICRNFHVAREGNVDQHVFSADRFLVAKWLSAERWDVVVFRSPAIPTSLHVMRVVGLPGEKIHIEDGAVWANGKRLAPPAALRSVEYVSEIPDLPMELWGSRDRPAQLGDDEYFVLGDFSLQSEDSRLWERGAPRHNPFAVPKSYLSGVVTHIYWPPERWRVLR